ncbi:MAG: SRPBCC family protein [Candidatus Aminicenantes bacterium]|nr:MAG: SRPBCC family protein [Candidatus Aminicenantes bacterium]
MYELRKQVNIPAPVEEIFSFFSAVENLKLIMPPWLYFKIVTPFPIKMERNALIDYSIKIIGLRVAWRTEITLWQPPDRFVDRQTKGPYRVWEHTHLFANHDGGTQMTDIVRYAVPGFVLSPFVQFLFVRPQLEKIFSFREQRLLELFPSRETG